MRRTRLPWPSAPMLSAALLGAALLSSAAPARAQSRPVILPQRDAEIVYDVTRGDAGASMQPQRQLHIHVKAGGQYMRMDGLMRSGYSIVDRAQKKMFMVLDLQHSYMELPMDALGGDPLALQPDVKFTKGATQTIAGTQCTEWTVTSGTDTGVTCLTSDGIMLAAHGSDKTAGNFGGLQAVSVTYATQPDSLFVPPTDYKKISPGDMMRGMIAKPPPASGQ